MNKTLSPEEHTDLLLSVGTHRKSRRLTPIQVAHLINRWQETTTSAEIARELGLKSTSMLGRFLGLLLLPVELQPLVSWGNSPGYISFSVAYEIARSKDLEHIELLTKDAIENQRTKDEIRAIIQCFNRGGGNIINCIKQIDDLRKVKVHHFLFFGKLPSSSSFIKYEKDKSSFKSRLAYIFGEENVLSAAIQNNCFSFTLNNSALNKQDFSSYLNSRSLEEFISNLLEAH